MAPRIWVQVDDQGTVKADFVAFPGQSCEAAEQRLRKEMARWGVVTRAAISPKPRERIASECARKESGNMPSKERGSICRNLSQ